MSWKLRAAMTALLLAPQAAFALGLGDIRLGSALNEPLSAEIDLVAPTSDELGSLSAQLAPRELFQRLGLDRPAYLDTVQFSVGRGRDGRNVLLVKSAAPISEPFVTFVVEVNWPRGRLLREYTVLLDPPVFAPKEAVPPMPVAAPRTERQAPVAAPAPAPAAVAPERVESAPAAPAAEAPSTYRVQRGDTLYGVASQFAAGGRSETNRMMIAMYRANPDAFGGNINVLRSGAILRIPGPDALQEVGAGEAASEIGRQTAAWRGGKPAEEPARLRLVSPPEPAPGAVAPEPVATDPAARIEQLNREIEDSRRLLELKSQQLAQLQQQVADAAADQAAAQPAPEAPEAPVAVAPVEPAPAEAPAQPAEAPVEAPPAEAPPAAAAAPPASVAERSFIDLLTDNLKYVLGAAVLLLGGGLAYGFMRRRREEEFDDSIRSFEPPASAPVPSETMRLRALSGTGMVLGTTTEDQELEDLRTATIPPAGRTVRDQGMSLDETLSIEGPADLDKGDPLAEADFHMAYGLYDQAADIVRLALEKEPGRPDFEVKLLEIFFVSGDKAHFLEAARKFAGHRSAGDPADWDRVVIMGRQLAPDDPLFEGATAGVDLNLEGGDSRVDFELLTPPPGGEEGVDLDLGQALGSSDSAADTGEAEALDFDLERGDRGTGTSTTAELPRVVEKTIELPRLGEPTAEMPRMGEPTAEMPRVIDKTAELPRMVDKTAEMPAVKSTRPQTVSPDATAELAMDDLGIDLGDLDALSSGAPEDDVTALIPGDEAARRMPAAKDGMDFDLGELSPGVSAAGEEGVTQIVDVGRALTEDTPEFAATEQIALDDLPHMSELEPVTMSEVGTKLDLARAYVDMGDPDGARSILGEVLKEGSASQKQEARRLLDSLPGG